MVVRQSEHNGSNRVGKESACGPMESTYRPITFEYNAICQAIKTLDKNKNRAGKNLIKCFILGLTKLAPLLNVAFAHKS